MIINSVKCTATATEWTQQLKNAYLSEMKNSTRFSIYMNPQGGLKAFSSPQSAQNENYRIVLTTEQVIAFTQTFFDQLGNVEGGFSVEELKTLNHVFKKMSEIEGKGWFSYYLSPTVAKINGLSKLITDKLETRSAAELLKLNNDYSRVFNQLQIVFNRHFKNEGVPAIQILEKFKKEWRESYNDNPRTEEEKEKRIYFLESSFSVLQKRCETFELISEVSTQVDRWVKFKAKAEQYRYSNINMLEDLDNSGSVEISEVVQEEEPDFASQLQRIKKQIFSILAEHDDEKYQKELNQILASTSLDSLKRKFKLTKAEIDEIVAESYHDITQTQASFQVSFSAAAQNNSVYKSMNQSIHNRTNQSVRRDVSNINNSSLYIHDPLKYSSIVKAKGKNNDLF